MCVFIDTYIHACFVFQVNQHRHLPINRCLYHRVFFAFYASFVWCFVTSTNKTVQTTLKNLFYFFCCCEKLHILNDSESECCHHSNRIYGTSKKSHLSPSYDMVCYLNIKYKWKVVRVGGWPFVVAQRLTLRPGKLDCFTSVPASSETCHLNCHYRLPSSDMPTSMAVVPQICWVYIAFASNE